MPCVLLICAMLKTAPTPARRPERLKAILTRLESTGLISRTGVMAVREATDAELEAVHSRGLIDALARFSAHAQALPEAATQPLASPLASKPAKASDEQPDFVISSDALCSAGTYTAARLAAGAAAEVAQSLAQGKLDHGVAIVRPPGEIRCMLW